MKTYIADIIPKLQRYSKKLDTLTKLTNQHWVIINELSKDKTVYIFRENGELLISNNGVVSKNRWELLSEKSILIDTKDQSYLFNHGFLDENILALKIDSRNEYAVFVNEKNFNTELNNIDTVFRFLDKKFFNGRYQEYNGLVNRLTFMRDKFSFKMGSFSELRLELFNGYSYIIGKKNSNNSFFIKEGKKLISFPDERSCVNYVLKVYNGLIP